MFYALVTVCAASLSGDIDRQRCFTAEDTLGPYITAQECQNRTQEIADSILYGPLNWPAFARLQMPEQIYVEQFCATNSVEI